MKTTKMFLLMGILYLGVALGANCQSSNGWQMILNNDRSAFKIKLLNNEMTFCFNAQNDTLSFSQVNKKPVKAGFIIEIILKNNNKVIYTSSDKNLNADKTEIVITMADVSNSLKNIKLPSKPKYQISIKDKTVVKEKFTFEFSDNKTEK